MRALELANLQMSDILSAVEWVFPFLISVITLLLSITAYRQGRREKFEDQKRLEREKEISRRENSARARQQYNADIRVWANACISVLSECLFEASKDCFERQTTVVLATKLSALADQGRLFFPNKCSELSGSDNESAYRGLRPRILDWLIYAHNVCRGMPLEYTEEAVHVLTLMKRGFTSDAQEALSTQDLFVTMEQLQEKFLRNSDAGFMDTAQNHDSLLKAKQLFLQFEKISRSRARTSEANE